MESSILSAIDRITTNALADGSFSQASGQPLPYIASTVWKGPMAGYYFGTSNQGTGYYLDSKQRATSAIGKKRQRDDDGHGNGSSNGSNKSSARKVRFGADEIKTIPSLSNKSNSIIQNKTPDQLLEEAENEHKALLQKGLKHKSLDLSSSSTKGIKPFLQNLHKSITKNELLRIEFPNEPEKFMESELALYEDIEVWNDLAASTGHYKEFVKGGAVDALLGLLGHENVDVALAVVRLFGELLDPGLYDGELSSADGLGTVMASFLGDGRNAGNGGLGLVVGNLSRLRGSEEEERKGIDDTMSLIESLLDLDQIGLLKMAVDAQEENTSVVTILCKCTSFVSYIMTRIGDQDSDGWDLTLKLHASELLATILQHEHSRLHITNISELVPFSSEITEKEVKSENNKKKESTSPIDGMECILQCIAAYRKKDPRTEEECEYLENIFDGLAASLLAEKNVEAFLERQGIELMLRCIHEGVHSGHGAMKVLQFAFLGSASCYINAAEVFVDAGGYKMLFPVFMGKRKAMPKPSSSCDAGNRDLLRKYAALSKASKGEGKKTKPSKKMKQVLSANREWYRAIEENSIQILYGLTRHLNDASPHDAKARLLVKFVENECEKCDRMVEFCLKYDAKMRHAEYAYFKSDEAEEAEENGVDMDMAALSAKLAGGGELFHRISAVIAFAASGSKRCHEHVLEQLRTQNSGIGGTSFLYTSFPHACFLFNIGLSLFIVIKAAIEEFTSILDEGKHREQLKSYLLKI